jgi:hypothetical protein
MPTKKQIGCFVLILLFTVVLHAQKEKHIRKNALKTTFLSFITGSAKLTYERSTFPRQSFEITGGIIGIGYDKFKVKPRGGLFRTAYKFMFLQPKDAPLQGLYVKPEYALSIFNYNAKNMDRINSSWHTIMGCVGYQWGVKMFILDGFVGTGIGWGNTTELNYHHGFVDHFDWLTLTFGIRIGLAF